MVLLHGFLVSFRDHFVLLKPRADVYSLARNNQAELFEDNQRDLERAVENLGYALEQNITEDPTAIAKLRQEITNQSVS